MLMNRLGTSSAVLRFEPVFSLTVEVNPKG